MSRQKSEGGFMTQSTHSRPKTSHISRNKTNLQELMLDPELNSINKIKIYKQEIKKLEMEYQDKLTKLNQSKKNIGRQYRDSQKKKIQFVNLYENRKLKLYEQRLLEEKSCQDNQYKKLTRERAKTIKLNNQIRSLLIKNQMEETNSAVTTKNKLQKHRTKEKLHRNREKELEVAHESYFKIRSSEYQLQSRKRKIGQMQVIIARQNYLKKMGEELKYIDTFDKMLNQVCEATNVCSNCSPPTEEQTFFITQKKN